MSNAKWANNELQFARLIAEIEAAGGFTEQLVQDLCASMDLKKDQVTELIDRAQSHWDEAKDMPTLAELLEEGEDDDSYAIGDGYEGDATEYIWKGRRFVVNQWHDGRTEISELIGEDEDED